MLHKVKIETAGDADMLPGDMIDVNTFDEENRRLTLNGRENATGKRTLLGITKLHWLRILSCLLHPSKKQLVFLQMLLLKEK